MFAEYQAKQAATKANREAKSKKRERNFEIYFDELKKEVMDPKWNNMDLIGWGTPREITEFRNLLNVPYPNIHIVHQILNFLEPKRSFRGWTFTRRAETQAFLDMAYRKSDQLKQLEYFYNRITYSDNIYPNTHENSEIEAVEINPSCITLYFHKKNVFRSQTSHKMHIGKFIQNFVHGKDHLGNILSDRYRIDDMTMAKLRHATRPRPADHYESPKEKINIEDCLKIYTQVFELISKRKMQSNAPFTVIIGEAHDFEHSLVGELIVYFILLQFGLSKILSETPAENSTPAIEEHTENTYTSVFNQNNTPMISIDNPGVRNKLLTQFLNFNFDTIPITLKKLADLEYNYNFDALKENKQYQSMVKILADFDILMEKSSRQREATMGDSIDEAVKGTESQKPDESTKLSIIGAMHLLPIIKILSQKQGHNLLPLFFDSSVMPMQGFCREDIYPITSKNMSFVLNDPSVERISVPKNCEYYTNTEILNFAQEANRIFSETQTQLLEDDMTEVRATLGPDAFKSEMDAISSATLSPALKRYNLRELMRVKGLNQLDEKLTNGPFQISRLNETEKAQVSLLRF